MKDLGERFFSGLIGTILLVFILLKGGIFLSLSVYGLSIIGVREFYKAFKNINLNPIGIIGYLFTTGLFLRLYFNFLSIELLFAITVITLLILITIKDISIIEGAITLLGLIYIPFLLFHIVYLDGTKYIWLIFIIAFGTDTFAYMAGNLFGKHKLCPKLSPKKTIEGSIGGIVGSLILSLIFAQIYNLGSIGKIIGLSLITSIISQLGDLTASKIKRVVGIKDYGNIMPGHGGVMDRFDSIIFAAPIVYYYIEMFLI